MDRLISEQKVIEAINDYWGEMETPTIDGYINAIKSIPSAEPYRDMEEIEEIINCDAAAEIKLKMISNIVHSKPHHFKTSHENKIIDEHYWKGFSNGIRTAEWRATKQEPAYCDRNTCIRNEYNGIGCDKCEVTKSQDLCEDAMNRILKRMWNCRGKHTTSIDKVKMEQIIRDELPSVKEYITQSAGDEIRQKNYDAISRQAEGEDKG